MHKHSVARVSLLGLALVLALGASGAAFAKWCDSVVVQAVVESGDVDVRFSDQKSNDWSDDAVDITIGDPAECGLWTFGDIHDPGTWDWSGIVHIENKEVASTDCEILAGGDRMRVTVTNGYPCYWGDVAFSLDNIGTIPVHIAGLRLISFRGPGAAWEVEEMLGPATVLLLDADDGDVFDLQGVLDEVGPEGLHDFIVEFGIDLSIHLSELNICQQIEGMEEDGTPIGLLDGMTAIPGDICVHVEQAARQNARYEFVVKICACQWNEVPCGGPQKELPDIYGDSVDFTYAYPGTDSYFNVSLTTNGTPPADEWFPGDGTYKGWCMDTGNTINHNAKLVHLESTLDPLSPYYSDPAWRKVNWLLNHGDPPPRVRDDKDMNGYHTWGPLQRAIWYFVDVDPTPFVPPVGDESWPLINAAQFHGNYIPTSGEMHAVLCILDDGSGWQPLIVEVDP